MSSKETDRLLEQPGDLLVLQLRQSGVPPEAIGRVLGLSAKSVRNRYPLGKAKSEDEEEQPQGSTEGTLSNQIPPYKKR